MGKTGTMGKTGNMARTSSQARHGSLTSTFPAILALCLLLVAFAAPVLAQDFGAAEKFMRIQASSDSLGFGSAAADSMAEVAPVDEGVKGLMGLVDRSPLGKTPLGSLFVAGGGFMWWILLLGIVGFGYIIERLVTLNSVRVNRRRLVGRVFTTLRNDGVQAAAEECQRVRGPVAAILCSGLQKANHGRDAVQKAINTSGTIEMAFLERGLVWISSLTTVAPLLGLLGTVSGLVVAFKDIAASNQVTAKLVSAGVSQALISTAFGLIVAVPAMLAYSYFVALIDRFVVEMEETSDELIAELDQHPAA